MAYTSVAQIRALTNITSSDISDADITTLIGYATAQLNSDINTRVIRERVGSIDLTRENSIDGSNTTFYVKNWKGKFIADMNNDGSINSSDIIVYIVNSTGTESTATVSTVTSSEGKFVLSSAPTTATAAEMYITYEWCFDDPSTPSARIALACAFLTASYAYEKINAGMSPQQVYGNVRFMRDMQSGNKYFKRYTDQISMINSKMGDYATAEDIF